LYAALGQLDHAVPKHEVDRTCTLLSPSKILRDVQVKVRTADVRLNASILD